MNEQVKLPAHRAGLLMRNLTRTEGFRPIPHEVDRGENAGSSRQPLRL
jgi:hypothetical protein